MPKLALGMKPAEQSPYSHPSQNNDRDFSTPQMERRNRCKWRDKPDPAQQVPGDAAPLTHSLALDRHQTDVPGFHGKGLATRPEPAEIDAKHHKEKGLEQEPSLIHRVAHLAQVRVYVASVDHWPVFNAVYATWAGAARPARAVVPTGPLHHGFLVEVEAVGLLAPEADRP